MQIERPEEAAREPAQAARGSLVLAEHEGNSCECGRDRAFRTPLEGPSGRGRDSSRAPQRSGWSIALPRGAEGLWIAVAALRSDAASKSSVAKAVATDGPGRYHHPPRAPSSAPATLDLCPSSRHLVHSGLILAFRFERPRSIPQPATANPGVERLVIGQAREIAEEPVETAQRLAWTATTARGRRATGLELGDREG